MDTAKLPAHIERATNLGPMTKLHLQLADGQRVSAQVNSEEAYGMTDGMDVYVDLREAKVFEEREAAEIERVVMDNAAVQVAS